ncbi:MAG: carbon storage regulator [Oceanospirillales bacterium]|nr:carbon storage regulator [Oceanospirillales bacterium]
MSKLALTRRNGESVIVDHDIIVTVLKTKQGSVQLCFDAPDDVDICRAELEGILPIEGGLESSEPKQRGLQ